LDDIDTAGGVALIINEDNLGLLQAEIIKIQNGE
jgi:hypothetical protein